MIRRKEEGEKRREKREVVLRRVEEDKRRWEVEGSVVFTQQKGVKRGSIYSLFHNKYLEDNKTMYICNHSQKISNVCKVSL